MKSQIIMSGFLLLATAGVYCQTIVAPLHIPVSNVKTTSLIFSFPIVTVDIGSALVIGNIPKRTTNILELKATRAATVETNASVVTSDGHFYAFALHFSAGGDSMVIRISPADSNVRVPAGAVLFPAASDNKATFSRKTIRLRTLSPSSSIVGRSPSTRLWVRQIAVDSAALWFELVFSNRSHVVFPLDELTFSIETRRRSRRTAVQSLELLPSYTTAYAEVWDTHPVSVVMAFPPFTVSKNQHLLIRARERKGSRVVSVKISGKQLLRAKWLTV